MQILPAPPAKWRPEALTSSLLSFAEWVESRDLLWDQGEHAAQQRPRFYWVLHMMLSMKACRSAGGWDAVEDAGGLLPLGRVGMTVHPHTHQGAAAAAAAASAAAAAASPPSVHSFSHCSIDKCVCVFVFCFVVVVIHLTLCTNACKCFCCFVLGYPSDFALLALFVEKLSVLHVLSKNPDTSQNSH